VIKRFPKMAVLWYVIALKKFGLDYEKAKAFAYYKALFYAVAKNRGYSIASKPKQNNTGRSNINNTIATERIGFENVKIDISEPKFTIVFGKKKPTKITADDFDKKVLSKFENFDQFNSYCKFAEALVKDKVDSFFKSRWYKELWVKIRDLSWDQQSCLV